MHAAGVAPLVRGAIRPDNAGFGGRCRPRSSANHMSRLVLGINSVHADSSAALVGDNGIIAAIAEERLNRKKHCAGFPKLAVGEVLRIAGARLDDVTDIAIARDPKANLQAKL